MSQGSPGASLTLEALNRLPDEAARTELERCCGARRWIAGMLAQRPFPDRATLLEAARDVWRGLGPEDWREAFTHHPRIGDIEGLRKRFATTAAWASAEQAGASSASEEVLRSLAEGNRRYEERFGHIFIVCATGKSAAEMNALLYERLGNDPETELRIAAGEQAKITQLRLEKLLSS
ncbi:MAG TPA: 2-oxo-4-hydroxy-4-carboxy-5-ureidoimidazoline decarboxylase [Polyangia bacterium]|jgi:2-oxo-4-hydroxy-4-carboxy-5-ureidoimidazoline decarboxylase|nr:2-oxo-4-hydroxy-4-carboxy-5-ureidoimidazoline decarboxylase [Polyangia bacterium]